MLLSLSGCGSITPLPHLANGPQDVDELQQRMAKWPMHGVLLLGEQHDADAHQQLQRDVLQALAKQGRLAALVLEMSDQGQSTRALPSIASEWDVQAALGWNDRGWPWRRYGPVVMAAVRAGVPVVGGNLPRAEMSAAQRNTHWDTLLPEPFWSELQQHIQAAHCDLLPLQRLPGMARIQVARDATMAATVQAALHPEKLVLLVAGQVHADKRQGVPRHLQASLPKGTPVHSLMLVAGADSAAPLHGDEFWVTPELPAQDHCATLAPRPIQGQTR